MKCEHKDADKRIWLPLTTEDHEKLGIDKHPYCAICGTIKNLTSDHAKAMGYYANILADMRKTLILENKKGNGMVGKFTDAQVRLIVKELLKMGDFEDKYWRTKTSQIKIFRNVIKKYRPDFTKNFIEKFL